MHILILGATGRVGSRILAAALSQSHTVTALVRNPSSLPGQTGLTIIEGTPLKESDILRAITSSPAPIDVVITALNNPRKTGSPFAASVGPADFMENCVRNLDDSRPGLTKIPVQESKIELLELEAVN
ncbi:hypothetical protein M7I_0937 [Glarea lozoyensis 74030]|uniref:NAD(P)-binding domain-containing protein n=1 Tax=Glarea lozoyensis (strain ATCC 74030 / MF5533) TaxID=1104152 RepID=H0EEQ7_GLAL7|nr:hypothetical protein M7I_0937 [Glarea lozoyensis 74030]